MNRKIVALLSSFALSLEVAQGYAAQTSNVERLDFSRDIGLLAANRQGRFCLSIKTQALPSGQDMTLIWVSAEPASPEISFRKIRARLTEPCDPVNRDGNDATYELDADKLDSGRVYFAIVGHRNDLKILRNEVSGRSNHDETIFRSCTSMEGLHFFVWARNGLKARKVWHRYYYLGYDVEPSCNEADFSD